MQNSKKKPIGSRAAYVDCKSGLLTKQKHGIDEVYHKKGKVKKEKGCF